MQSTLVQHFLVYVFTGCIKKTFTVEKYSLNEREWNEYEKFGVDRIFALMLLYNII